MRIRRSALLVAALGCWPAYSFQAQTVAFDFDGGTPPLSKGQSTPFDQTSGGITARFSSPSGAAFSVQSDASTGFALSLFSGNYLYDNDSNRNVLDMKFSRQLTSISLNFATADFHQIEVPTAIQLTAYVDSTATVPVGSATAHGTYGADTMPMGTLTFTAGGKPFNVVEIAIPFQPLGAAIFLVDNVRVTTVPASLTSVSAANYLPNLPLAPNSIASAFGANLAAATVSADRLPLPTLLGGVSVKVADAAGKEQSAPLFFVSPGQINYLIAADCALGPATARVMQQETAVAAGGVQIDAIAPGLFSANSSGTGVAAAVAVRAAVGGGQTSQLIFRCSQQPGSCVSVPVDPGGPADEVILLLFGTGIRGLKGQPAVTARIGGADAAVLYAGPQADFAGLDQVNVRLPRSLAGRGESGIVLTVEGKETNTVTVNVL